MATTDHRSDAELVSDARGGDASAVAAMYARYADRLHSYLFVMLRSPEDAADATSETFVKAATRLSQLRDPSKLRPWLFAIARNEAAAIGRHRARVTPDDDLSDALVGEPDMTYGLAQEELKELVWSAVDGLQDRDRELMTLHLVEGLDGDDLAEALGVATPHLHVMLSRMRTRVEKSLGALLIARLGRDDCEELNELLEGWDGRFSLDVRSKVTRHVEGCEVCSENRAALVTPVNLLPSVVFVPAPAALGELTVGRAVKAVRRRRLRRRVLAVTAAVFVVVGAFSGGVALTSVLDGESNVAAATTTAPPDVAPAAVTTTTSATTTAPSTTQPPASSTTTSTSTTTTTTTEPPTTTTSAPVTTSPPPPPPAALEVSDAVLDLGDSAVAGRIQLTNTGGVSVDWIAATASAPFSVSPTSGSLAPGESVDVVISVDRTGLGEGDLADVVTFSGDGTAATTDLVASVETPPTIASAVIAPTSIFTPGTGCRQISATVEALVDDDTGVAAVEAVWGPTGGSEIRTPLTGSGGFYLGQIGPFSAGGVFTVTVVATDVRGNTASLPVVLQVVPCP